MTMIMHIEYSNILWIFQAPILLWINFNLRMDK